MKDKLITPEKIWGQVSSDTEAREPETKQADIKEDTDEITEGVQAILREMTTTEAQALGLTEFEAEMFADDMGL